MSEHRLPQQHDSMSDIVEKHTGTDESQLPGLPSIARTHPQSPSPVISTNHSVPPSTIQSSYVEQDFGKQNLQSNSSLPSQASDVSSKALFEVGDLISSHIESPDLGMQRMASRMKLKMDKYWRNVENVNIFPFVAFVLDPRYKLHYLELVLEELYDDENSAVMKSKVQVTMRSLFHTYNVSMGPTQLADSPTFNLGFNSQSTQSFDSSQRLKMKFEKKTGRKSSVEMKNVLDKYLSDDTEPIGEGDTFDILLWWKDHTKVYLVLSLICRDLVAIPSSTVAFESTFSTGGRVLDSFRSSLTPRMVEYLICGQDWIHTSHIHVHKDEILLDLENLEQEMKDLVLQQPLINIDEISSIID